MEIRSDQITVNDIPTVDDFVRRVFYANEPLIVSNGLEFWSGPDNLPHQLIPHGLSVKAHAFGKLVGIAVNDGEGEERRIYNSLAEDAKPALRVVGETSGGGTRAAMGLNRRNRRSDPMYDVRAAGPADIRELHGFFVRTLYAGEPLFRANARDSRVPSWDEGLCSAVVPQGISVVAVEHSVEHRATSEHRPSSEQEVEQSTFEHQAELEHRLPLEHHVPVKVLLPLEQDVDIEQQPVLEQSQIVQHQCLEHREPLEHQSSLEHDDVEQRAWEPPGRCEDVVQQPPSKLGHEYQNGHLRIIGAVLNDKPPQPFPYIYTNDEQDVKFQTMFEYMEKTSDVLRVAPSAVEIRLLAVDEAWRGRGVARALIEASMRSTRDAGYKWVKIYCTSHFSNLLITSMKWTLLYSLRYEDYASEFDSGIKVPPKPHTHCHLYICDLTKVDL